MVPSCRPELQTLLYSSGLARGISAREVETIMAGSRVANRASGITGFLVFDSTYFAQLLEGPAEHIDRLLERLRADRRHVDVKVLFHGPTGSTRRYADWHMGYAEMPASRQGMVRIQGSQGDDALCAFDALVSGLTSIDTSLPNAMLLERLKLDMNAATDSAQVAIRSSRDLLDRC